MNLIYEPKIYLVGRPSLAEGLDKYFKDIDVGFEWKSKEVSGKKIWNLTEAATAAEILCMAAGKVCYNAFGKGRSNPKEYFQHILESGHGSILEHATWNFIITGVSRTFSHEHVRHRVGVAISQRSQRYVKESDVGIISQKIIEKNTAASQIFEDAIENSQRAYDSLIQILTEDLKKTVPDTTTRIKTVRSAARSVMPNATETIIFWSANARALRHYIDLRATEHAEIEIRKVAFQLLKIMKEEAPSLFDDYTVNTLSDGTKVATSLNKSV